MGKFTPIFLLFCSVFAWFDSVAQTNPLSNVRKKTILIDTAVLVLDSLSIVPNTLQVYTENQTLVDSSFYVLDQDSLKWKGEIPTQVQVKYRVFPFNWVAYKRHLDSLQFAKNETNDALIGFTYNPYARKQELLDFKGLDYNGSFARGISFGNSQDLVLNSSFNLQIAGNLGEDIELLAAITDENIPIQPEGNTQQLQEFDRIFIQLKRKNNQVTAGDYELRRPDSYFMNYFKKLQGATYSNTSPLFNKGKLQTQASVAIARGKFARNEFLAQEGNQGPYKLNGAEGERFIIVLAGTEKVWIDGLLMQRGLEQDYTIDYNRGELTFTANRLITNASRIIIEFEYSDQNYLRSLYALNTSYTEKNWRVYFNLYNEQDSKNSSTGQELSNQQKELLSNIGDNFNQAIVSSVDTIEEFSPVRALYEKVDTILDCGLLDTILVYSIDQSKELFTARYSFVGAGNGNYRIAVNQDANERVFEWVPPINCLPQGDYEPIIQLIAPQQQQMMTLGTEYKLSKTSNIKTEFALSRNDLNRFSSIDSEDDQGIASFTTFSKDFALGSDSAGWILNTQASYEFVQENFRSIKPYRNAEFIRDWNLSNNLTTATLQNEHLTRGTMRFSKKGLGDLSYTFSGFWQDSVYNGTLHDVRLNVRTKKWEAFGQGNLLLSDGETGTSRFFRPKLNLVRTIPEWNNWRVGVYGELERNERTTLATDTLSPQSFFYELYRVFVESPTTDKGSVRAQFSQRLDFSPVDEAFEQSTLANELNVTGNWNLRKSSKANIGMEGNFSYRQLAITNDNLTNESPAETYLGRVGLNANFLRGVIRLNTTYEIGSGQEPKVEFNYLPVEPGRGNYIWLDSLFNNDGVIQNNEMAIAPFQDVADFVRVTTFTDEFIRTNNINFNQNFQLNPKALWGNKKRFRKWLSRISTLSTLKINRKTQEAAGVSLWNPFQLAIADSALVSVGSNIRNTLFFNRFDPKYEIQLGQSDNRNKFVQTSGFESRLRQEFFLTGRWNISKAWSTELTASQGNRKNDSEQFDEKDFNTSTWSLTPSITILPNPTFRTILRYAFQREENSESLGGELLIKNDFQTELTYNSSSKTSIRAKASLINVNFDGEANSPIGFALLNGLQTGRNYLWEVNFERRFSGNIQLTLRYEGRQTGNSRVVHVGRAQVAAFF